MRWQLSEEQDAYQEAFRDWLSDVAPPDVVRRWLDAGDAAAFEKLFADDGWAGRRTARGPRRAGRRAGRARADRRGTGPGGGARPPGGWRPCSRCPRWPGPGAVTSPSSPWPARTRRCLMPAECVPDEAPPLSVGEAGVVSGSVPRVLAGDTAVRFVAVAGGPGSSGSWRPGPRVSRTGRNAARPLPVGGRRDPRPRALRGGSSSPTPPGCCGRLRRVRPSWWPRTPSARRRGCWTWPWSTASSATSSASRSARSRRSSTRPPRSWSAWRRPGRPCTSPPPRSTRAARSVPARGRGQGAGHRRRGADRRQRAHPARGDRLHLGARPAAVLQASQARREAPRHPGRVERAHRRRPRPR